MRTPARRYAVRAGYSVLELVFVLGLIATVSTVTVPGVIAGLDEHRAAAAARYVAARLQRAGMEAVIRSRAVAVRFTRAADREYVFTMYVDGNANGVTAADIGRGRDPPISPAESIANVFAGVDFGV